MMKFSRYNSLDEKPASSLSGELFKKKSAGDEWNKRWFSIEGTDLCWYDDSRSETARGAFDLKTLSRCEMDSEDLTMELRDATRDLDVRAKTEGEMLMWHRAIEMYADLAKGGDGTGRVSAAAPKLISRTGPGVHSAEFDHVSRSGKFDISRTGPGVHSMDFDHASRSGKFNPEDHAPPVGGPVWRSDQMTTVDDGKDLTYDEQEEKDDIFSAEPKPYLDGSGGGNKSGHMISRNKSSMYHSQEVKYPSVDEK